MPATMRQQPGIGLVGERHSDLPEGQQACEAALRQSSIPLSPRYMTASPSQPTGTQRHNLPDSQASLSRRCVDDRAGCPATGFVLMHQAAENLPHDLEVGDPLFDQFQLVSRLISSLGASVRLLQLTTGRPTRPCTRRCRPLDSRPVAGCQPSAEPASGEASRRGRAPSRMDEGDTRAQS